MTEKTIVHVMRHGEVHNPDQILYGRLPDFHLSEKGRAQAARVADWLVGHDITYVVASPLERAQETAAPIAATHGLSIDTDADLIESENVFEGERVSPGDGALRNPRNWWHLRNPRTPSWGEPYEHIAQRMQAALYRARDHAKGHEAVCVSHQLPTATLRRSLDRAQAAPPADRGQPDVQPRVAVVLLLSRRRAGRLELRGAGRTVSGGWWLPWPVGGDGADRLRDR